MFDPILWTLDCATNFQDFEKLCNELFLREGYSDINPLGGNYDNGRDAEVKVYKDKQGHNVFFQYSLEENWEKKLRDELINVKTIGHSIDVYIFVTSRTVTGAKEDSLKEEVKKEYGWDLIIHHRKWLELRLQYGGPYFDLARKYLGIPTADELYDRLTGEKDYNTVCKEAQNNWLNNYKEYIREKVYLQGYLPKFPAVQGSCSIQFRSLKVRNCMLHLHQRDILKTLFKGQDTKYYLGQRGFLPGYIDNNEGIQIIKLGQCSLWITEQEVRQLCSVIDDFAKDYFDAIEKLEAAMGTMYFQRSLTYPDGYRLLRIDRRLWGKALDFANSNSWRMFSWCDGFLKIYTEKDNDSFDRGFHTMIYPEEAEYVGANHRISTNDVWLIWRPMTSDSSFDVFEDYSYKNKWNAIITYNWLVKDFIPEVIRSYKLKDTSNVYCPLTESFNLNSAHSLEELAKGVSLLQQFYTRPAESIFFSASDQQLLYSAVSNSLNMASFDDLTYIINKLDIPFCINSTQVIENLRALKEAKEDSIISNFEIDCALRVILHALNNRTTKADQYNISKITNCLKPYFDYFKRYQLINKYS